MCGMDSKAGKGKEERGIKITIYALDKVKLGT